MDGITAEFYIIFWGQIKDKLMQVYKDSFIVGILPESLRTGVVTLLGEKRSKIDWTLQTGVQLLC